jgi:hypothetical protein
MSKRISASINTRNPTGFSFKVKHQSVPSGTNMSMPNIDLSKPVIKFKAKSASSSSRPSPKKGGRKTRKNMRKKTHRKKHVRKTYRQKLSRKHRKK